MCQFVLPQVNLLLSQSVHVFFFIHVVATVLHLKLAWCIPPQMPKSHFYQAKSSIKLESPV